MTVMSSSEDLVDSLHMQNVFDSLNDQRTQGMFCDVTIVVEDIKFKAHRNVLAASSPYFQKHFLNPNVRTAAHILELNDFKAAVFTEILNFIYSSKVVVKRKETLLDLVAAGKKLGITFLENLKNDSKSLPSPASIDCSEPPASPGPIALYSSKGSLNAENSEKAGDDHAVTSGPRITNAFSIVEAENNAEVFCPLDLRPNFKRALEDMKAAGRGLSGKARPFNTHPVSALAEHSYAVSSMDMFLQRDVFLEQGCPPSPEAGKENQPLIKVPIIEAMMEATKLACSTPKKAFLKKYTSLTNAQIQTPPPDREIKSDQSITPSLSSDKEMDLQLSCKNESNSSSVVPNSVPATETLDNLVLPNNHFLLHKRHQPPFKCKNCSKAFTHHKRLGRHEQICLRPVHLIVPSEDPHSFMDRCTANDMPETLYADQIPSLPINEISSFSTGSDTMPEEDHFVKVVNDQVFYICIVCQRHYVTLSSLRRHSNVHSWRKTYPCHYCNQVFALAEYRTKHEIWHTGDRRYQCIFCLETFMTYYILKNHQKSFHGIDPRLGVSRKTANGGIKASVYPYKLYRLLPMKGKRTPYKAPISSSSENVELSVQNCETISTAFNAETTLNSEPSAHFQKNRVALNSTVTPTDTSPYNEALTALGTINALPLELRLGLNRASVPERSLSPFEKEHSSSIQEFKSLGNQSQNVASIISCTTAAPSVIMHSSRVSSVIVHGNEVAPLTTIENSASTVVVSQTIKEEKSEESGYFGKSSSKVTSLTECTSFPFSPENSQKELDKMTGSGVVSKKTMNLVKEEGKTETYIAKPALPGRFITSGVEPLCQITVRIGSEAIVRRHIPGSNLFYKRGSSRHLEHKQKTAVEEGKAENRERSSDRLRRLSEIHMMNDVCEDTSDHEFNDKSWRPYDYKSKKKSKHLKKFRKVKKRKKGSKRHAKSENEKGLDTVSSLEQILTDGTNKEDIKEEEHDTPIKVCDGYVSTEVCNGDVSVNVCDGNVSTKVCDGDVFAKVCGGEVTPKVCDGEVFAKVCDGEDSVKDCDGEVSAKVCDGDVSTKVCVGDVSAKVCDRDVSAKVCDGDVSPTVCDGDVSIKVCDGEVSVKEEKPSTPQPNLAPSLCFCKFCEKPFRNPSTLKAHMRCHTGEKPYCCETCGRCFSFPGNLHRHERIHRSIKKYICQYCGKTFSLNERLQKHERIHTGARLYECKFCPRSFLYMCTKRNHEQRHKLENGRKAFVCLHCSKVCKTAVALSMHQRKHFFKSLRHRDRKTPKHFTNQPFKEINESSDVNNCSVWHSSSDITEHLNIHGEGDWENLTTDNVAVGSDTRKSEISVHPTKEGDISSTGFLDGAILKLSPKLNSWECWQVSRRDVTESEALYCHIAAPNTNSKTVEEDNTYEKSSSGYR